MIKNVVFDVGGVLLDWNPLSILEKMFDKERAEILKQNMMDTPYWAELDRGALEIEDAVKIFSKDIPHLENDIEFALTNFIDYLPPIQENVEVLKHLSGKGFRLFVLSNFQKEAFDTAVEKFEFFKLFDGMVVSARINMIKPDKEIYDYILNEYQLKGNETVFFDDTIKNIHAASAVGIIGVHTPSYKELHDYYIHNLK